MAKKYNKGKINRGPLNASGNWFKNVIKSMGYTSLDIIKDVVPSTAEFVKDAGTSSMNIINNMRSTVSEEKFMDRSLDQISPLMKISSKGLKNALEDIKTGNFYNKEREAQYMQEADDALDAEMFGDFDDDFSFGDEFNENDLFVEADNDTDSIQQKPRVQPVKVINDTSRPSDFIPAAQLISESNSRNTMATTQMIKGIGGQQKAFQIQNMLREQEFHNTLFTSLASIGDNLSSILKIKVENESKFISLGTEFFGTQIDKMDELIKYSKGDDRSPEEIKDDNRAKNIEEKPDIFLSNGGLNLEAYKENIKSNLKNLDELSFIFDSANTVIGDDMKMNSLISNPIASILKISAKTLMPKIAKESLETFDESIGAISGAIMGRINKMEDSDLFDETIMGTIKSYFSKIFGYNLDVKTKANLGNYEKGPVPFDGITRKTINDVIPIYLRRIESAITNTDERFFNYDEGIFESYSDLNRRYEDIIRSQETLQYVDVITQIRDGLNALNIRDEEKADFENDLYEYFTTMNHEAKSINPFVYKNRAGEEVDELDDYGLFLDYGNRELFRNLLKNIDKPTLLRMMGADIFDSVKSNNEFYTRLEQDPSKYGYKYFNDKSVVESDYETDMYDPNKKVKKKTFGMSQDKFGLTTLDYLRDIRTTLLNGIKVFIAGNINPLGGGAPESGGPGGDGNDDLREKMRREEEDYENARRARERFNDDSNKRSIFEFIDMDSDEIGRRTGQSRIDDYIDNIPGLADSKLGKIRNKINEGLIKITEGPAEKINQILYNIIFGRDPEADDDQKLGFNDIIDLAKTKVSAFHSWTINAVYKPIKESLIGKEGIITKFKDSKFFKSVTDKKKEIIDYLFGVKDFDGNREGGFLSGFYNKFHDVLKSFKYQFTGKAYTDSEGNQYADKEDSIFKGFKNKTKDVFDMGKEKISSMSEDFMEGYRKFRINLFGKASEAGYKGQEKKTMQGFVEDIKSKLPKAAAKGTMVAVGKGILFSKAGLLGSLFLPGGPIGAALTGTTAALLLESDKFKNWLFGEKDPEDPNKRLGGFIPKSLQDLYSENKMQIKIGGGVGAAVGLLPSFFLPGGPLTGAILGITAGLVTKSDAFQEFLYGPDFKDGEKSLANGVFGKAFAKGKDVFDKYGVDPKQATFLGGIGAVAGGLGLLPTFFLPGGPIGGALLGMAGGIVASSNKFQEFLLGEKQWDGKRHGGLITKFSTWFDIHVVDSLKITMKEWNLKVSDFLYDSIAEPFLKAAGPVTKAMQDASEKVKDIFKAGWDKINDNVVGVFKDNVVKPFGESLEKYIVDPLKKFLTKGFNLAGKILGTIVATPFKIFEAIGNKLDKKNEKNAVKDEKQRRRSEAYENIKNDIKSGNFSFRDLRANIRNARLSKEEREELIKEATAYRDKYEQGKEARDAKRAARREKLQSEIDEMKANQRNDAEFFRRNGKFRNQAAEDKWNQQQKEKQAWYQQHIAESGMETVEKLDEINKAMKDLQDSPKILSSMEEGLLNELRELKKVMEDQLAYFKQEGFVDTSYLRRKKETKPEPVNQNIHFNMNNDITSKPEVSPMFKNANNISKEAQKKQDPRINNIIDILRRNGQSHEEGLGRVPYDGYVAELHEGERVVPPGDNENIDVKAEKEKFKMLNSIKRHTRMIADEIKGQLYGVGSNLHNIRKILQHMSGLKDDNVKNIKDQNIPDGGTLGKFIHNMKVKIGSPVDFIKEKIEAPMNWISDKITVVKDTIISTVTSVKDGFVSVFESLKEIPGKIVDYVGTGVNTVLTGLVDGLSIAFKGVAEVTVKAADIALTGVSTVVGDMYNASKFLVSTVAKSFVPVLTGAGKAVGAFAEGIGKASKLAIDAVVGLGKGVYTVTKDLIGMSYTLIKDVVKGGIGAVKGVVGAGKAVIGGGLKFTGNLFGVAKTAIGGKKEKEPRKVEIIGGKLDEVSRVSGIEGINLVDGKKQTIDDRIRANIGKMKLGDTIEETSNAVKEETKNAVKNEVIVLEGKIDTIGEISKLGSIDNIVKVRVVNPDDIRSSQPTQSPQGGPTIQSVKTGNTPVVNIGNLDAVKGAVVETGSKAKDVKEQYKDQIKEQIKAQKQQEKEQEAKEDRQYVSRLSADYVQEQKRVKKEQLLETQYKEETMKDIDSTDKTLTKQYDFWYDLFGKNGKIHTKLKNLWEWAKKLFPMLLSWFKGTRLFNFFSKLLSGTGAGTLAGTLATTLAPALTGLLVDQLDKKEREERADKYNISDDDAYMGLGKESRYANEEGEYILNGDRKAAKYNVYKNTARDLAKNNIGEQVINVGKNIATNAKNMAGEKGSKILEKGGNLFNTLKSKLGFGKTAANTAETGLSTVEFFSSEILDESGKVISEGKYRVIDVADDVAKNNEGLIAKLITKAKDALINLIKTVANTLGDTKLGAKAAELISPIIKKLSANSSKILSKYSTKITTFFSEKTAGMATLGLLEAGFAIWNAGTGLTKGDTANLFGVKTDQVDWKMRMISAGLKTATNFSWIGVIYLVNEILADIYDINLLRWVAGLIYKAVASIKDSEELSSNQDEMKQEWQQYKQDNNSNISFEAYLDKESPTVADKIANNSWAKNFKATFDKGSAANALGKNKEDLNLWDRVKFGVGHTANNFLNIFRKDKKSDSEFFLGKEQVVDETGMPVLDENGNPQYKEASKKEKKTTKKSTNELTGSAGMGDGPSSEIEAIRNGFTEESSSTSEWLNQKTAEHKGLIGSVASGFNRAKASIMAWYTSNDDDISKTLKKKKSKVNIFDRRAWRTFKAFNWAANLFRDDEKKLSTKEEVENIMDQFKTIGDNMWSWLKAKTENIKSIISAAGKGFASIKNKFTTWWTGNDETIASKKGKDPSEVTNWDRATDKISGAWEWGKNALKNFFSKKDNTSAETSAINNSMNSINPGGGTVTIYSTDPTDTSNTEDTPAYAQGTPWVPETEVALVHEGEMVIPAEKNPMNPENFVPYSKMVTNLMSNNEGVSTESLTNTNKQVSPEVAVTAVADMNKEEVKDEVKKQNKAIAKNPTTDALSLTSKTLSPSTINIELDKESIVNINGMDKLLEKLYSEYEPDQITQDNVAETTVKSNDNNKTTTTTVVTDKDGNTSTTVKTSSKTNGELKNPDVAEIDEDKLKKDASNFKGSYYIPGITSTSNETYSTSDSTSDSSYYSPSTGTVVTDDSTSTDDAYIDTSIYDSSSNISDAVDTVVDKVNESFYVFKPLSKYDKVKQMIERKAPRDSEGKVISGDPLQQNAYYSSEYMKKNMSIIKDPVTQNGYVTSYYLKKEADKKKEEERKRVEKVNSEGNSTGAQVQRDINKVKGLFNSIMKNETVQKGIGLFSSINEGLKNDKTVKSYDSNKKIASKENDKEQSKSTGKSIFESIPLLKQINDGLKNAKQTGTNEKGEKVTGSKSVEKSSKEAWAGIKSFYNASKKSFTNAITAEDDEVRDMYGIKDNGKVSIGQRIKYKASKPFTDFINDITGKNELSYGGGGAYLRDKYGIIAEGMSKTEKDKTGTVSTDNKGLVNFVKGIGDKITSFNKDLSKSEKDKTGTVSTDNKGLVAGIQNIGKQIGLFNKNAGKSEKDKTGTVSTDNKGLVGVFNKIGDTFTNINKNLGKSEKDKTGTVSTDNKGLVGTISKIGDLAKDINNNLKRDPKKEGKKGNTDTSWIDSTIKNVSKTFQDMNSSLKGSDNLTKSTVQSEDSKVKKTIQSIGNKINKGVRGVSNVYKQFSSSLNKTSRDADKNFDTNEKNPFKTNVEKFQKKITDNISSMGDAYNKFKDNISNKINGAADKIKDWAGGVTKKGKELIGGGKTQSTSKSKTSARDYSKGGVTSRSNRNTITKSSTKQSTNKTTTPKKSTPKKATVKKPSLWSKVKKFLGFGGNDTKPLNQQVKAKNYVFDDLDDMYLGDNKGESLGGLKDIGNTHNYAYYSQLDERWSESKIDGKNTLGLTGCGPTSAAMILTQMTGQRITPDTMSQIGTKYLTGYTSHDYFPEVASKFKLNYDELTSQDTAKLKTALKNNEGVVLSGFSKSSSMNTPFTKEGHIVVATGIKGDKVQINDPRGPGYSGEYNLNDVMRALKEGFVLSGTEDTMKLELPSSGKYGKGKANVKGKYTPKDIIEKAKQEKEALQEKISKSKVVKTVSKVVDGVKDKVSDVIDKVKDSKLGQTIKKTTDKIKDKALELKDKLLNTKVGKTLTKVVDSVKNNKVVKKVTDTAKKVGKTIKDTASNTINTVKKGASSLLNKGKEILGFGGSNTLPLKAQIKAKNYVFEDSDYEYTGDNKGKRVGGLRDVGNTHNFAYYSQLDERWSGDKSIGGSTIGEAGCGPTSAAMVLTQITGQRITPDTMAQIGGKYLPGYSSYSYFPAIASKFKLNYSEIQPGEEYALKETLQSNKPVILSGFNRSDSMTSPYTSQGHIIVATGMKGNRVQVNDPRGPGYSGEYALDDIMRGMKRGFVFTGTKETLKAGLPSSGKYSNVSLMDKYQMNEDLPDEESMNESLGSAGQIRLWEKVVGYARAFLGKLKYSYGSGAIDNNGMTTDCSHFTAHVINRAAEMNIPPGSAAQRNIGKHVTKAQAGDLVVWPGHAGLVVDSNGNMIDAGSGTVANFKSYTKSYWGKRTGRTFRRVLDDPNKLVDPRVKNYHTKIGFNGIVNPQGGGIIEAGTGGNGIENFLFIGDSMMKCMEPIVKKDTPSVKVVHAGGKEASYFLQKMDTLPKDGVEGVVSWIGVNGVMNSNKSNTKNTTELLSKLASRYSGKKVYAMKVFPVGQKWSYNGVTADKMNPGIQELNSALQSYTSSNGMGFIDATSGFVDDKGYLTGKNTDGLHLYGDENNKKILGVIKSAVDSGSGSSSGDSTGATTSGGASSIPELGVFEKLSQGFTNVIASMYNGQQVDLFASSGSTDSSTDSSSSDTTSIGVTGSGDFPKYQLNDSQIKGIAHILEGEQPGAEGMYAEASLMANLVDKYGNDKATTANLIAKATGGWFAHGKSRFNNPGNPNSTAIQAVKDVLIAGKRTLPRYVDEHDCFSDLTSVTNNGAAISKTNRSAYKPHVTKIRNRYGASGTFYTFPNSKADPFYYTDNSLRQKWGENHYSVGSAGMGDDEGLSARELTNLYGETAGMDGPQTSGGVPYTMNNYAYFSQVDPTWNESAIGGASIKNAGCGPTSLAIIATQLTGKLITPRTMATAARSAGHWSSNGALWSLFPWFANKFGMKYNTIKENDIASAKKELKAGHPIAVSGRATTRGQDTAYTPSGHIVPFVGVDSSNNIIVNDPRGTSRAHAYTDQGLAQGTTHHLRQGWAFIPPASVPNDIKPSGDYDGSTGAVTNVTDGGVVSGDGTSTGEGSAPQIPELGVFEKLSQAFSNVIASMYNGQQVDLFATSSTDSSSGTSSSDGTNPDISGQDTSDVNGRKKAVWTFFTGKGYSKEATAGIMGNMHTESGGTYSPSIIQGNGRGPAAGICQWENWSKKTERWKELSDYAASKGKQWTDMQSQLEFIDMELAGRSKDTYTNILLKKKVGGYEQFKQLKDISKAVVVFERSFERAGVQAHAQRTKYAKQNYDQFANAGTGSDGTVWYTQQTLNQPTGTEDWTYYDQTDPEWNNISYDGNTVESAGCGPTSLAMAASDITGESITPDTVASEAYKDGVWSDSSSWDIFPWFADKMNFDYSSTGENDLAGITNMLSRGQKVVASGISTDKKSPFTKSGHIVSIVGQKNNGNFIINDPRGKKYSGEYAPDQLSGKNSLLRGAWGYKKSGNKINKLSNEDSTFNKQMTAKELYANAGKGSDEKVSYVKTAEDVTKVSKEINDFNNIGISDTVKQLLNEGVAESSVSTTTEMNYVRACLESLNIAVNELKSINTNTRETADNVSKIKIYSANEPVSNAQNINTTTENKKKNNIHKKSKTLSSPESDEYYIARKIASFNK